MAAKRAREEPFKLVLSYGAETHAITVDTSLAGRETMAHARSTARVWRGHGLDAKARRGVVTVTARKP